MSRWKGALVGCGFFARNHLQAWRDLAERCDIVAVCDLDLERARAAAEHFGIKAAYGDVHAMIAHESLHFVDIATTAPSHRTIVETCAAAGLHAIVQRPLAPDWNDACALVEAMARRGLRLMVHENFRFQAPLRRAAALYRSGAIGRPTWGRFSFRTGFDVYAGQPYLANEERFAILDLGIHVLDVARVFMGEVASVYCRTQSIRPGIKGEDMATMLLGHESGATSVVDITYASRQQPDPFPQTLLHLEGTSGSIRAGDRYRLVVTTADKSWTETVPPPPLRWGAEPWLLTQDSVLAIQTHWLDCLDRDETPETSGVDNLKTFALVEAAYLSAALSTPTQPRSPHSA